jgi:hypothetical protein
MLQNSFIVPYKAVVVQSPWNKQADGFDFSIIRGPLDNFMEWRQCAAVMQREGSFKTTVTLNLMTISGIKITPLLRYPQHYNLA